MPREERRLASTRFINKSIARDTHTRVLMCDGKLVALMEPEMLLSPCKTHTRIHTPAAASSWSKMQIRRFPAWAGENVTTESVSAGAVSS